MKRKTVLKRMMECEGSMRFLVAHSVDKGRDRSRGLANNESDGEEKIVHLGGFTYLCKRKSRKLQVNE